MMPSDTNTPQEFPPMQPMAVELVDCIAAQMIACGENRKVLTRDDRFAGRVKHPQAMLMGNGDLVVTMRE